MTSTSRFTTLACLSVLLAAVLASASGCGKTDLRGDARPSDPRTGATPAAVSPRWDPPTVANGFVAVPRVEAHPPLDHR